MRNHFCVATCSPSTSEKKHHRSGLHQSSVSYSDSLSLVLWFPDLLTITLPNATCSMSTWRDSVANKKNMAITPGSERALAPKPVSSTSSMETTLSGHLDMESGVSLGQTINTQQALDSTVVGPERTYANQYNMQAARVPDPVVTSSINSTVGQVQISPSTGVVVPSVVPSTNTVPEFLYQLTKMLTDNNRDIIEWSNGTSRSRWIPWKTAHVNTYFCFKGKIEVHNPHKLQTHVLNRYFRHSKFASFQRQLNYFGFRKLAGKGKMAPCSYVNDATTKELGSLLLIKVGQESV